MKIEIDIPLKSQIINGGFEVQVAQDGKSWDKDQLGSYSNKRGVYIHHSNGEILYIGKATTGKHGTFYGRLYREFKKSASSDSNLYKLLEKQRKPIRTYLFDFEDISMMVNAGPIDLNEQRKALILELVLIGIYKPIGNKAGNEDDDVSVRVDL